MNIQHVKAAEYQSTNPATNEFICEKSSPARNACVSSAEVASESTSCPKAFTICIWPRNEAVTARISSGVNV